MKSIELTHMPSALPTDMTREDGGDKSFEALNFVLGLEAQLDRWGIDPNTWEETREGLQDVAEAFGIPKLEIQNAILYHMPPKERALHLSYMKENPPDFLTQEESAWLIQQFEDKT